MPEITLLDFVLVEDNEDHAALTRMTLKSGRIANGLTVFGDAESALRHLRDPNTRWPPAVLVDIDLPGMNGLELLRELKSDPVLQDIPVVILTTSDAIVDRQTAQKHGANCYLTKPLDFKKLRQMVKDLGLYWGIGNLSPR